MTPMTTKAEAAKEFRENRTSWKWFARKMEKHHSVKVEMNTMDAFQAQIMLEILKELQRLNDKL